MAYRKYNNRRYRKRPSNSGGGKYDAYIPSMSQLQRTALTAAMAYKTAMAVKGMINAEKKYRDNTTGNITLGTPGTTTDPVLVPTLVAQGDGENQRDGSKIRVKELHMRGPIEWNSASGGPQRVRCIIGISKVIDGDYPQLQDILQDGTDFDGYRKISESRNFYTLHDKVYLLNDQKPEIQFSFNKQLNNVVKYVGTGGSETDCGYGAILMYLFTDDSGANRPNCTIDSRIRYYDN